MRHRHLPGVRRVLSVAVAHLGAAVIVGVGVDLVEVERIRRALADPRHGERFCRRVFTPEEIAYCRRRRRAAESFAARFAAKEAVMKALGRGFGGGIGWREIEIVSGGGPPRVRLRGRALAEAEARGAERWHLSLSHTAGHAVAIVIAEGRASGA